MNKPTQTAELLAEAAKLLYDGEGWLSEFARDVEVDKRTILAWFSGKKQLEPDNTVMDRAAVVLMRRAQVYTGLADRIARNRAPKPAAPPRRARATPSVHSRSI